MKITKKVISLLLTAAMIISVAAATTVTANAEVTYGNHYIYNYNYLMRDYSYGNWPGQTTYNSNGWIRLQSKTEEEIANGELGKYGMQFQWHGFATDRFNAQMNAAMPTAIDNGYMGVDVRVDSAKSANPVSKGYTEAGVEIVVIVSVDCYDADGNVDNVPLQVMKRVQASQVGQPGIDGEFVNFSIPCDTLQSTFKGGQFVNYVDWKIKSVDLQAQEYTWQGQGANADGKVGVGDLDIYFSPVFVDTADFDEDVLISQFGAPTDYTTAMNPDNFTFVADEETGEYSKADLKRDSNKVPLTVDGIPYTGADIAPALETTVVVKPVAPTVTASSIGTTSATLSWPAVTTATDGSAITVTKYTVLNAADTSDVKDVTGTSISLSGLKANTAYTYKVRAVADSGVSGYATVNFTTKAAVSKPSAPKISKYYLSAKTTAKLYWGKVSGATKYYIYTYLGSSKVSTKSTTGTSYSVSGLKLGKKYTFKVYANNSAGTSSASSAKYLTTLSTSKPSSKVTGAKKSIVMYRKSSVTGAVGYQFQYGLKKSFSGAKSVYTTSTKKTIKSLKSKKTYYVRVRAYNTVNGKKSYGSWSTTRYAKTK